MDDAIVLCVMWIACAIVSIICGFATKNIVDAIGVMVIPAIVTYIVELMNNLTK